MATITEETAETKSEISALLFAHKHDDFHSFISLAERMLDKYSRQNINKKNGIIWCDKFISIDKLEEYYIDFADDMNDILDKSD